MRISSRLNTFAALTAFAAFAVAGLIWLPIGHAMIGIIEEWDLADLFQQHGVFFVTSANSPMPALQIRPLNVAPQALAYVLGRDSFLSWHVLLALSLALKAIAMTVVARWLLRDRWIAMATGLLLVVYPADTMQMTLRSLHIDWSVTLSVMGLALILAATGAERRGARWILSGLGGLCFVVGSLIYEANLFLAPAPLILWWARHGSVAGLRRQAVPMAAWCAFVALNVGYLALISHQGGLYQQSISQSATPLSSLLAERLPLLFTVGMYREFLDGWYDAARMLATEAGFWPFLALLALVLLVCLLGLKVRSAPVERLGPGRVGRTALAGFLLACLGYLPYLSSGSHVLITQRTHLVSAVGAALAVAALLQALSSRPAVLSFACWTAVLSLGLGAQWLQLDHYTRLSLRERMILAGIAQAAPDLARGEHVLIIDRSGQLQSTWMMKGELLMRALSYLYHQRVVPEVCVEPGLVWADFASDDKARPGRCVETASAWNIGVGVPGGFTLPKQGLITLTVEPDGAVRRDAGPPQPAPTPAEVRRWRSILGCWPAAACHYDPPRSSSFHYDWGTWWSLEEAPWGAGWRDALWDPPGWIPRSYAWMNAPQSRLWMPLQPVDRPYELRIRFYAWVSPAARASLRLDLNGRAVRFRWGTDDTLEAVVDAQDLIAGLNDLTLSTTLDPTYGTSGAVDWVDLTPAQSADRPTWRRIDFSAPGNWQDFATSGWWQDSDGPSTWTEGTDAVLDLPLPPAAHGVTLVFDVYPFLSPAIPKRTVTVLAGDRILSTWTFEASDWSDRTVPIPPDLNGTTLHLDLREDETRSPKELGLSGDPRHLGIAVRRMRVVQPPS